MTMCAKVGKSCRFGIVRGDPGMMPQNRAIIISRLQDEEAAPPQVRGWAARLNSHPSLAAFFVTFFLGAFFFAAFLVAFFFFFVPPLAARSASKTTA